MSILSQNNTMKRIRIFVLLSLLIPAAGYAQPGSTGDLLTLDECISAGLENNIEIIRNQLAVMRAESFRKEAYGQFLPNLSATGSWTRFDRDRIVDIVDLQRIDDLGILQIKSRNSFSLSASSSLTLFDGMANFNTVDQTVLEVQSAELALARAKQNFVYNVQQSYYNALRLKQLVVVNDSNLSRAQQQLARIEQFNAVGSVPRADVLRQQVEVGRQELQYQQALNNYENAVIDLLDLIGDNPSRAVTLDDGLAAGMLGESEINQYRNALGTEDELYAEAFINRLDLASSELQKESAEKGVDIAFSGYLPSLTAGARYSWTDYQLNQFIVKEGDFSYGLTLSIPILSNLRTSASVQRAEIAVRENEESHAVLLRSVKAGVKKAVNSLAYAEKNVLISKQTLQSAKEDQRIAAERYTIGSGTLLELVTANANLTAAESDVVNATFDYLIARKLLDNQIGNEQ